MVYYVVKKKIKILMELFNRYFVNGIKKEALKTISSEKAEINQYSMLSGIGT